MRRRTLTLLLLSGFLIQIGCMTYSLSGSDCKFLTSNFIDDESSPCHSDSSEGSDDRDSHESCCCKTNEADKQANRTNQVQPIRLVELLSTEIRTKSDQTLTSFFKHFLNRLEQENLFHNQIDVTVNNILLI